MTPLWKIRRDPLCGLWRVYYLNNRTTAFYTWQRCIEYVDQHARTLHANYGGRL